MFLDIDYNNCSNNNEQGSDLLFTEETPFSSEFNTNFTQEASSLKQTEYLDPLFATQRQSQFNCDKKSLEPKSSCNSYSAVENQNNTYLEQNPCFSEKKIIKPQDNEISDVSKSHTFSKQDILDSIVVHNRNIGSLCVSSYDPNTLFKCSNLLLDKIDVCSFPKQLHHLIPRRNPYYIFNAEILSKVLLYLDKPCNDSLYITGPSGCGKTSLICQIASCLGWPIESITLSQKVEVNDLIGHNSIINGKLVFEYGPLARAMLFGEILLLNEIDLMLPGELAALNDVLERGALTIVANNGEVIYPHPFFRVVATANTRGNGDNSGFYNGTRLLNQAFLDRWRFLICDYQPISHERKMIEQAFPLLNPLFVDHMLCLTSEIRLMEYFGNYSSEMVLNFIDNDPAILLDEHNSIFSDGTLGSRLSRNNQSTNEADKDNVCFNQDREFRSLSAPFTSRSLLRICFLYYNYELLSVTDAIKIGFASRLPAEECVYVLQLASDIFGYDYQDRHQYTSTSELEDYYRSRDMLVIKRQKEIAKSKKQMSISKGDFLGEKLLALAKEAIVAEKRQTKTKVKKG